MTPASVHDNDQKLVELCRAGDRIAFDRLVVKYQHLVVGMCIRLTGSRADGEDTAQECFVKVYRHINRFSGESTFSTWLYRIVINTCRNRHRSWWNRLSRQSVTLNTGTDSDGTGEEPTLELSDTRFTPVKDLEHKRLGMAIEQAIGELPREQKELVLLRDLQGLSYEEIERITGLAEGTVKSRLFRARNILQQKLKGIVQ
ncbi:MAG: sigma-70 family RNA polymerase sigma factor [Chitinispirillaceae bacterium]|nr:sigma-70 family RNA polymerase sigma factor [Chitinispirillaceae bacterium]